MALLYKQHVFLATPRTSSNSMFYALRSAGATHILPSENHHSIPNHEAYPPTEYRWVAAVRNHFDWLVSTWIKATWRRKGTEVEHISFKAWLETVLQDPNCQWGTFTYPGYVALGAQENELFRPIANKVQTLVHCEALESELKTLLNEPILLPTVNQTPHKKDYRRYYDDSSRKLVESHYAEELDRLGYHFDNGVPWKPRSNNAPLTGGALFDENNQRKAAKADHGPWTNLANNAH